MGGYVDTWKSVQAKSGLLCYLEVNFLWREHTETPSPRASRSGFKVNCSSGRGPMVTWNAMSLMGHVRRRCALSGGCLCLEIHLASRW